MKKFITSVALGLSLFLGANLTAPDLVVAQNFYQNICSWQTYCAYDYYGNLFCYQREECCGYTENIWTGAYVWQCWWR